MPRYNSTPSKKSEMSEDEGSFLLGSDSRKTSEQQLESTLISNSDERSSRVSSCEEHKVIKICHQDTAEQTDEEGEIKAENVAETEAGLDELKQEETPRKTEFRSKSDSDREIEDQVNSIIEKISKEYEMGKSGWQYRLTVDTDDKSNEVIPEEQRNGLMNEDVNGNASEIDGEAKDTFQTTVKGK